QLCARADRRDRGKGPSITPWYQGNGSIHKTEARIRPILQHTAQLHVDERQRLETSGILELAGANGIETDGSRHIQYGFASGGMITRNECSQLLAVYLAGTHVLRENGIEGFDHVCARQELLQLFGTARRESHRKPDVTDERVGHIDDRLAVCCRLNGLR